MTIRLNILWILAALACLNGCSASYRAAVRPTPHLSSLAPEFYNLTDAKIEQYLKTDVTPVFPTTLAIVKVEQNSNYRYEETPKFSMSPIIGDEAEGWQELTDCKINDQSPALVSQVHFINPIFIEGSTTVKKLRNAAALVHAPMLLVYLQTENTSEGYNSSAMAYWSIVGLFVTPGNTVGSNCVCQAFLVDTRTGSILATLQSDAASEENVLPGAVDIARDRVRAQARIEAANNLQDEVRKTLVNLAASNR
jgi:hypothetical protein